MVHKLCVQYQLTDTTCIVAGDCGFGFYQEKYYNVMLLQRNNKRLTKANNRIVFIRGNHDNPAYFYGKAFVHKHMMAIPDNSVVKVNGHTVLCIGGAVSIDRMYRQRSEELHAADLAKFGRHLDQSDPLLPKSYWKNEAPVYNEEALTSILSQNTIDTVVTHTAPSFCELISKDGIQAWAKADPTLVQDIDSERKTLDLIYQKLKGQPITHWCYGHFHQSWHASVEGTLFKMLDIMELYELPQV